MAQAVVSLGTEVAVRKDWKVVAAEGGRREAEVANVQLKERKQELPHGGG